MEKHGATVGGKRIPEYYIWVSMKQRCNNPTDRKYKNYGGRGIKVCPEWQSNFARFLKDVGYRPTDQHSLERIDNDGNYEPGNVKWATKYEQVRNSRHNVFITVNGRTQCAMDLSTETGINRRTILYRYRSGWTGERILDPSNCQGKHLKGKRSWNSKKRI